MECWFKECPAVAISTRQPTTERPRTLAGNVRRHLAPVAQPHARDLALARVGLLGLDDADLDAHALHLRASDHERRHAPPRRLRLTAPAQYLHQRRGPRAGGREEAGRGSRVGGEGGWRAARGGGEEGAEKGRWHA
jgi:hypothetical protein